MKRFVPVVVAVALVGSGLLTASVAAEPAGSATRSSAAPATCRTQVVGVDPSGRIVKRQVTNTRVTSEKKSAAPLPFRVDYLFGWYNDRLTDGLQGHYYAFRSGQAARLLLVKDVATEKTLPQPTVKLRYRPTMDATTLADSGRYYTYGVDPRGNLMRWTKFGDEATNNFWFDTKHPKLVARNMGSLKTLSFLFYAKLPGKPRTDILYGTTRSGALKQFQIPWNTPGKAKVTTLKSTGFAQYTSLSLSWCNRAGTTASIIAIDKVHNQARWYHLTSQYKPNGKNLVRHPLVAPGRNWRLHATF